MTLYLDGTEVTLTKSSGTVASQRYYDFNGMTVAQRQGSTVVSLAADHNGTPIASIRNSDGVATKRYMTPFGEDRAGGGTWNAGDKAFVGGTRDAATGLTHLGAREYDAAIGRFISVDSVVDPGDPQQLEGYAYANNSPITSSDPTGLRTDEEYYGAQRNAQRESQVWTKHDQAVQDVAIAHAKIEEARQQRDEARKKLVKKVTSIVKIIADLTGVSAAIDCWIVPNT